MPAFTRCLSRPPDRTARTRCAVLLLGAALLAGCATPRPPEVAPGQPQASVLSKSAPRPTSGKPAAQASAQAPEVAAPSARPADAVVQIAPLEGGRVDPTAAGATPSPEAAQPGSGKTLAQGLASWYGPGFHGRRTASGERFDMHALTAAHKTLPFGTRLRVRSVHTGKEVVVRINDRGPYKHSRIIDLSLGAIKALGLRHRGVTEVVLLRE